MRAAPVLLLFLSGCAGISSDACGTANWYDLGFRDALYGIQPQDLVYAEHCAVDTARYAQGFREGRYEFDRRASQSQD